MPESLPGPRAELRRHRRGPGGRFRTLSRTLIPVVVLAGIAACAPEPAPPTGEQAAVEAALDSVFATFSRAYAEANVQLLMDEVYARDAYYLPPDSPILQGQDQFRGQFSFLERYARADTPGPSIEFDVMDRRVSGDMATDIGTYTLRSPDAPDDAPASRGKFIVIWTRTHDGWRIQADAFSSMETSPPGG
jgi:ketosteroid isomerase-like protein